MSRRDWLVAGALALCAVAFAACGASSESGAEDPLAAREEAGLEFAECMREHGVEVEDPQPGQAGVIIGKVEKKAGEGGSEPLSDPATDEAMEACGEIMEDAAPELSAEEEEEHREQALAFAQCMREHGVEMPDPEFSADGKMTQRIGGPGAEGPAPDSPAFEAAQAACQEAAPEPPVETAP
ncbi:MAG: hypothetical protein M3Y75_07885 [Actinomycetota bacterium]|nr:hypothetical protein [Actinomycetota bacterium]